VRGPDAEGSPGGSGAPRRDVLQSYFCNGGQTRTYRDWKGEDGRGETIKLGIIICDRYRTCAGGKCLRALRNREGAFERYKGRDVELVGFATCNGCPGGNV